MKKLILFIFCLSLTVTMFGQSYYEKTQNGWEQTKRKTNFKDSVNFGKQFQISGTTVTATGAQLNYLNTTTSNVQTQLNAIASVFITVAATDATAREKARADYQCDGTNDEVQWALANTAAAGGVVKLVGHTFDIQDDITLTSTFEGVRATGGDYTGTGSTKVSLKDLKQIKLQSPGNIKNLAVVCATRNSRLPAVQLESTQTSDNYEHQMGLLDGVRIYCLDGTGVGLQIYVNSGTLLRYISFCVFGDINVYYFSTCVRMEVVTSGAIRGWINSNTFRGFNTSSGDTMLTLNCTDVTGDDNGDIQMNVFDYIHMQCGVNTDAGIYISNGDNNFNHFNAVESMDWTSVPAFQLGGTSIVYTFARGYIPVINFGGIAKENNIISDDTPTFLNGGNVTINGGVVTLLNGAGEYKVEVESGTADTMNELYGCKRGQVIILRVATGGNKVTLSTYLGIKSAITLNVVGDFAQLLCIGGDQFICLSSVETP